jgi:hypothetical protein
VVAAVGAFVSLSRIDVVESVIGEHGAAGCGDRTVHRVVGVAFPGVPGVVGGFCVVGEALRSLAPGAPEHELQPAVGGRGVGIERVVGDLGEQVGL